MLPGRNEDLNKNRRQLVQKTPQSEGHSESLFVRMERDHTWRARQLASRPGRAARDGAALALRACASKSLVGRPDPRWLLKSLGTDNSTRPGEQGLLVLHG